MATAKARGGALGPDDLFLLEPTPCARARPHPHDDPPEVSTSPWLRAQIARLNTMSDLELMAVLAELQAATLDPTRTCPPDRSRGARHAGGTLQ